jgi:hypothetical protein
MASDATAAPASWGAWEEILVTAVLGLADGESVTVEAPERAARMAKVERRMRFLPAKRQLTRPWLRLTRMEDLLRGLCVGTEVFGAGFPWTPEEHAALLDLGWHSSLADGPDYVRFWPDDVPQGPYLPRSDAKSAAAAAAVTVREVMCPPVPDVEDPFPAIVRG